MVTFVLFVSAMDPPLSGYQVKFSCRILSFTALGMSPARHDITIDQRGPPAASQARRKPGFDVAQHLAALGLVVDLVVQARVDLQRLVR